MTFEVSETDLAFYARVSTVVGGQQLLIPPPTLSPDERQRRRLAFRNERFLYRTTCAITGRSVVSAYSPDLNLKVCGKDAWLDLDNCQFGRPFDFQRPFFEQFAELHRDTFKCSVIQDGEMVNSEFTHFAGWLKNCYLMLDAGKCEDCMYGVFTAYCRDSIDCLHTFHSELCNNCIQVDNCYELLFSRYSSNCNHSAYLDNCIGCSHCLCCTNLRNKKYYAFNKPIGKEAFTKLWKETFQGSFRKQSEIQQRFEALLLASPRRAVRHINCETVSGDELTRCQNVLDSYNCTDCRDCRFCYDLHMQVNDCYDVATFGESLQYCYELAACGGAKGKSEVSNCFFSTYIFYGGYNILYSMNCHENSQNLFGCCDLRRKQFCILNKQYTKEEYEALVPKIVEHMRSTGEFGEFFPMEISPFGYNQSLAQEFYPLSQEEVRSRGLKWSDYESPPPALPNTIAAADLPDENAARTTEEILKTAILCQRSNRPFRVTEKELAYYQQYGVALPRLHPEERQKVRRNSLNGRQLHKRKCDASGASIFSTYPADTQHLVYSEEEFLKASE